MLHDIIGSDVCSRMILTNVWTIDAAYGLRSLASDDTRWIGQRVWYVVQKRMFDWCRWMINYDARAS